MFENILVKQNYIAGKWSDASTGESLSVIDKYTQKEIAALPYCSDEAMEEAIATSVTAFHKLKRWSAGDRSEALQAIRDRLEDNKEAFAQLITAEAGKPIGYARGEVDRCLVTLDTAVSEALRFSGEMVPIDYKNGAGKVAFTRRFPLGPIACISPFNFPLNLALHKIAPAIAAGCTVVLKPAPQSPLTALAFAKLVDDANVLPKGAINILIADIPQAEKMVTDERFKMLSFTGSPQIGWMLKEKAGKKKVALELGGNAPVIIDATADIEHAAKLSATGAFLYAGQICISTQRIFVHQEVFDEFSKAFVAEVLKLESGDPRKDTVSVGPIIQSQHLNRIADWVEEAKSKGAKVLAGGNVLRRENNLYAPTVLTNTNNHMKVCGEEVFGPVATLDKVSSFGEAIDMCNNSKFGLQAGVFTQHFDHVKKAHEELEVGGVMINNIPGFRIDSMPYGGVKDSGLGREGIKYAMEEMTEPRLLVY